MRAVDRREILANKDKHHPSVVAAAEKRAASLQVRVADAITNFAGSMKFVYVHMFIFGIWIIINLAQPNGFDKYPFQLLTLIVSLEAIFLSTFVMIGQNRQAIFQQNKADRDFTQQEAELHQDLIITQEVREIVEALHIQVCGGKPDFSKMKAEQEK